MHWLNEGPYTGEISPTMLMSIGCRHVLLGHSEQRLYFNETDERVNLKLKAAINHGLTPIVCVGETLTEREDGRTEETIRTQIRNALRNVTSAEAHRLVIAYEPVWAIGTGSTATPEIAAEAHAIVRHELGNCCSGEMAERTRILYGGSVKPDNISDLMAQDGIDGALVGGASLNPETFAKIVHYSLSRTSSARSATLHTMQSSSTPRTISRASSPRATRSPSSSASSSAPASSSSRAR